jgi:hypothetical protein
MRKKIGRFRKLILSAFLVFVYCFVLVRGLNEGSRRSLQLRDNTDVADHIVISVLVTAVNPSTQELTAQISFRPQGTLVQDEVTPAVDLKLLTNNVRSPQEFDFPKGSLSSERRAEPISVRSLRDNIVDPDDHAGAKETAKDFEHSGKHRRAGAPGR